MHQGLKLRTDLAQFASVRLGQHLEFRLAFGSEREQHRTTIRLTGVARNESSEFQPLGQSDGGVGADAETFRETADARARIRISANHQKCLVLLRRQPFGARGLIAEIEIMPHGMAEIRQTGILGI